MSDLERWKDVADFEGFYMVSNVGRVKSRKCILSPKPNRKGYLRVGLYKNGKFVKSASVHSLVLSAFERPRKDGEIIRHLDGDPLNNTLENLRYGTYQENEQDKILHGTALIGSRHHKAKLTLDQVLYIRENYKKSCRTNGAYSFARKMGVHPQSILNALKGDTWEAALKNTEKWSA